jgi:hypothetical protein
MRKSTRRTLAVLKHPQQVTALIAYSRTILTSMSGNKLFPSPKPPLTDIKSATDDLEKAQFAAVARTHGAAGQRNEKRAALLAKLELLKDYVQQLVDADQPNAVTIISAASMRVRKVPTRAKKVFAATPGAVQGSVKLSTPSAGTRVSYDWQVSADAGKTWTLLPTTLQARTTVTGLPVGSYVFRFRVVTAKAGAGDWSNPVAITLH